VLPPIRERKTANSFADALGDGTIDMVVSDHSHVPEMKCASRRFHEGLGRHFFFAASAAGYVARRRSSVVTTLARSRKDCVGARPSS